MYATAIKKLWRTKMLSRPLPVLGFRGVMSVLYRAIISSRSGLEGDGGTIRKTEHSGSVCVPLVHSFGSGIMGGNGRIGASGGGPAVLAGFGARDTLGAPASSAASAS